MDTVENTGFKGHITVETPVSPQCKVIEKDAYKTGANKCATLVFTPIYLLFHNFF